MENRAKIVNIICAVLSILLAGALIFMLYNNNKQEKAQSAAIKAVMEEVQPYEDELQTLKIELSNLKSDVAYSSEAAEIVVGFVASGASDVNYIENRLKEHTYENILHSSYSGLKAFHTGELQNRMTSDVKIVADYATDLIPGVFAMDSTSMALVAQLVRNMVSVCYNNYDLDKADGAEDYIQQFFCLTHNPYFFKEITYNRVADYACVSFYELKKDDKNHSKVILCTQEKGIAGGGLENFSPVKNYYDGLWHEFRHSEDPVVLSIAMRGILEYYFMQMCGYPAEELRTALLKVEQTGEVEKCDYDLAYAFLSSLDSGRSRLDDGVDFDSSAMNKEQAKKIFKLIFHLMNQDQHYNLMTGEK